MSYARVMAARATRTFINTERTGHYFRTLTARAITRPIVARATIDCAIIASFAQRDSGIVSVGLKAVALVKLTYK